MEPQFNKEDVTQMSEQQINKTIIEALNISSAKLQVPPPAPTKVDEIQNQILSIINPTKIILQVPKFSQKTTVQDVQKYSLMKFFSQIYIEMVSQIMSIAPDLKDHKPQYQTKALDLITKTLDIQSNNKLTIPTKIQKILKELKQSDLPLEIHLKLILQKTIQGVNNLLFDSKYDIDYDCLLTVLGNDRCIQAGQTDSKTLTEYNNMLLYSRIDKMRHQFLPSVVQIAEHTIQNIVKSNLKKSIVKANNFQPIESHWAPVTVNELQLSPQQQTLNRFFIERSHIKDAMAKVYKQMIDSKIVIEPQVYQQQKQIFMNTGQRKYGDWGGIYRQYQQGYNNNWYARQQDARQSQREDIDEEDDSRRRDYDRNMEEGKNWRNAKNIYM